MVTRVRVARVFSSQVFVFMLLATVASLFFHGPGIPGSQWLAAAALLSLFPVLFPTAWSELASAIIVTLPLLLLLGTSIDYIYFIGFILSAQMVGVHAVASASTALLTILFIHEIKVDDTVALAFGSAVLASSIGLLAGGRSGYYFAIGLAVITIVGVAVEGRIIARAFPDNSLFVAFAIMCSLLEQFVGKDGLGREPTEMSRARGAFTIVTFSAPLLAILLSGVMIPWMAAAWSVVCMETLLNVQYKGPTRQAMPSVVLVLGLVLFTGLISRVLEDSLGLTGLGNCILSSGGMMWLRLVAIVSSPQSPLQWGPQEIAKAVCPPRGEW